MEYKHTPVMLREVLEYLNPQEGQFFIDCTLGGAGYTIAIAKRVGKNGGVVSFDLDKMAIDNAKKVFKDNDIDNVEVINDNFKNLEICIKEKFDDKKFDGVVMDLGMSSAQLDDVKRGISFLEDRPIDMAFGEQLIKNRRHTTEFIVNEWKIGSLERIFKIYGEEKFARNIAKKIIEHRKDERITRTKQLVEIIKQSIPKKFQSKKIHPATKVFQALRIATNNEIENLEKALPQIVKLLYPGGKIVIVSFHSLEDRIVKRFFKEEARDCICPKTAPVCVCNHEPNLKIITKKIVLPSDEEIKNNLKARSAKMRVAEKL
ncbi:16S rRNA (cytosine(1402)-N(4))-methyltransferase RsmH [Candidatus Parcubacteria bacterium]|nr:16S rRNA (cytosine(1402)-N(4))-methyltransferase RsmH [Candidatus Parcubacteria bacterium]